MEQDKNKRNKDKSYGKSLNEFFKKNYPDINKERLRLKKANKK